MRTALTVIIVILLVLVLGTAGVLGYGYYNAQADKAYATTAKNLVNDFENKYSEDYFNESLDISDEADSATEAVEKAKKDFENAKTDAQNAVTELDTKKASKRVAGIKNDAKEYFNLTIKGIDGLIAYLDYYDALAYVSDSLTASGGEVDSLADAVASFDTAKNSLDNAIDELEKSDPPAELEDFNRDLIAYLKEASAAMGNMSDALKAGDLALLESYTNSLMESYMKITALDFPDSQEIADSILSEDERNTVDNLPSKISEAADQINKKTFAF